MAEPFLRWAGGKRWLAEKLAPLIRSRLSDTGTFYEPFLGSGAMYFAVQPPSAVLSDINAELIATFRQVRSAWGPLRARLAVLPSTRREYLRVREWDPDSPADRAVRFLFLNRNCWGGLWRENKKGVFNVPYGGGDRTHRKLVETSLLSDAHRALGQGAVELAVGDFANFLGRANNGDVVYCDPTYRKRTRQHFDRYGPTLFGWEDQERLATAASAAARRGALVIVSNASCFGVGKLYPSALVLQVSRRKGLGPADGAATRAEYVFILDPLRRWSDWEVAGRVVAKGTVPGRRAIRVARASPGASTSQDIRRS